MTDNERYQDLASKWLDGTITETEKVEFSAWYHAHYDDRLELPRSFAGDEDELKERIFGKIKENLNAGTSASNRIKSRIYWATGIAATVLFGLLMIGIHLWRGQLPEEVAPKITKQEVAPGGNRAVLTLADGRTFVLSPDQSSIVIGEQITYESGELIAEADVPLASDEAHPLTYNEITTPKGGQYQILLPDGSNVWLNSGSSLRYPSRFAADRREVELVEGEAYFDVSHKQTKAKIPFLVKTKSQTIEVLGTEFNINAYGDEAGIRTTLVKGAISVHYGDTDHPTQAAVLAKGEQAMLTDRGMQVQKVDTEPYTAWKDGFFYFDDADIYTVMKQFARWYDFEVQYEIGSSDDLFVGKIPKNVNLATALNVLKSAGVNFELRNRHRLIVKPKNYKPVY